MTQVRKQKKARYQSDQFARVEQAVAQQANGRSGLIVEVMPGQHLVKHYFVDSGHQAHSDQERRL